jgi:predicted enzyme involved in methoxymalonyl-ACP biosynthesis
MERWHVDTFLLSCRIIGRTVEEALLDYAVRDLKELGATCITGEYIPTGKNGMVADLYDRLEFTRVSGDQSGTRWALDLNQRSITAPKWFEVTDQERISA